MVYESTGKFQLVEGDVDNFDKMMEAVGEHSISSSSSYFYIG